MTDALEAIPSCGLCMKEMLHNVLPLTSPPHSTIQWQHWWFGISQDVRGKHYKSGLLSPPPPKESQLFKHLPAYYWRRVVLECGGRVGEAEARYLKTCHLSRRAQTFCENWHLCAHLRVLRGQIIGIYRVSERVNSQCLWKHHSSYQMKKCISNDGFFCKLSWRTLEVILTGEMNTVQVARKGMEININQHEGTTRGKEEWGLYWWYKKIGTWKIPRNKYIRRSINANEKV